MTEVVKTWTLKAGEEYRFETDVFMTILLREGVAELFGSELAPRKPHTFAPGDKAAIYTWDGAVLERTLLPESNSISSSPSVIVEYVSDETPMGPYLNTHLALERLRQNYYQRHLCPGLPANPKALILGQGRKSVCRILANYAVRHAKSPMPANIVDGKADESTEKISSSSWTPLLVDLDVGGGGLLCGQPPGLTCIHHQTRPFPVDTADTGDAGGLSAVDGEPDALFFYGSLSWRDSPKAFSRITQAMATLSNERLQAIEAQTDEPGRRRQSSSIFKPGSGMFVCAPGECDEQLGVDLVKSFGCNVVLVIGNDRLHASLSKAISSAQESGEPGTSHCSDVICLKLPKSGGVVARDGAARRAWQSRLFRTYFNGTPSSPAFSFSASSKLSPFILTLSLHTKTDPENANPNNNGLAAVGNIGEPRVRVWRGVTDVAPSSALPVGATRRIQEGRLQLVTDPSSSLLYAILAVYPPASSSETFSTDNYEACSIDDTQPIAGVLQVLSVEKDELTVLAPAPSLPSKPGQKFIDLLVGSVGLRWIDTKP